MWYKFVVASRQEIENKFGKETYEIVKSIQPNLQQAASMFISQHLEHIKRSMITLDDIYETFEKLAELVNRNFLQISTKNNQIYLDLSCEINIDDIK